MTEVKIDNEELAAFVTSTLNGIASGVESAQKGTRSFNVPGKVSFEIAVKAVRTAGAGAGLKLQVFSAEGKAQKHDEEISRVSFDVISESTTKWTGPTSIPSTRVV